MHEESAEPMQARDFFDEVEAGPAREEPPRRREREPRPEPRPEPMETVSHAAPPAPAPVPVQHAEPVAFHAVSEHDGVTEEDAHKPVRRRPRHADAAPEVPSLQLVETQAAVVVPEMSAEDEAPRRTKPRRRRGSEQPNEPLKLVETQPGTEGDRPV